MSSRKLLALMVLVLLAAPAAWAQDDPDVSPASDETPAPTPAEPTITIKGSVEVAESGDDGKPKVVQITDEASKETYLIANQGVGAQCLEMVGRTITATGHVKEGAAGKTLLVTNLDYPGKEPAPGAEPAPAPAPPEGDGGGE